MKYKETIIPRVLILIFSGALSFQALADTEADRRWRQISFPIWKKHCTSCHNAADKKGGIDLDLYYYVPSVIGRGELFQKVVEQIETGEMPPPGKPRMTDAEKESIISLINGILNEALSSPDPGPSVVRRLSNREYTFTIRDLVGIDFDAMGFFPKDGSSGEGFDNQSGSLFMTPLIIERYYMAADSILRMAQNSPEIWKQLAPKSYRPGLVRRAINYLRSAVSGQTVKWSVPAKRAKEIILPFANKSYRRFLSQEEQMELLQFFDEIYFGGLWKESDGFDKALATTFKRVLISPTFLYRAEVNAPIHKPYSISNLELATRLSYFLWSSMPDDTLLRTAYYEDLHDPMIMEREAKRMMRSEKFLRFSQSFAPQWLGVEETLLNPSVDKNIFPEFTDTLRNSMKKEVIDYFHYVFTESRNLLELLNSDYSLLDESLAAYYGVPGVEGPDFRLVNVAQYGRGGVLGMGAVLTATSLPNRTSPVLRGQWVLEQILGTPAPPAPPDVPQLEEVKDGKHDELDVRAVLEKHRESPACAGCHNKMDPIGFVMENFDAAGRWRDYYRGSSEIDPRAVMENGVEVNGPLELRKFLSSEEEKFAKNFSRKMLSYALGRGISFTDSKVLKDMTISLLENNFDSEKLVLTVVNSYPFKHRRSDMTELYIKK